MKIFIILIAFLSTSCALRPTEKSLAPIEISSKSVQAFRDVCIKTAPSFSNAEQIAVTYGINDFIDGGGSIGRIGFTSDKSLTTQIKINQECTITTEKQNDKTLTNQLVQAVSQYLGSPLLPQKIPFSAKIANIDFIFHHDRDSGEAFVMLKR